MIYLALDPGLEKIGTAVSHEGKIAQPLSTIEAHNLINQIKDLIEKHHPDVVIIGEPDSGPVKELSVVLHGEVSRIFKGKVILHPEDLTSKEARKKMIEGGMAKLKRQKGEHAFAAALILQDYLESL